MDWASRVLVAADGRESSDAAIAVAWELAERRSLDVVSVIKTSQRELLSREARDARVGVLAVQLQRLIGHVPDGETVIEAGSPPDVIASCARMRHSSLLVVGMGADVPRDRILGEENALAIARRTQTPLLAVSGHESARPRCIVVGTDFSEESLAACEVALDVVEPDGVIVLARVQEPSSRSAPSGALWRLMERVQTGFAGHVMAIEREGDPANELFDVLREVGADTIALGAHGQKTASSTALGPVATRVLRCASSSVLLVPGSSW
jgi:nucleotide-binding universal stress UspA family protein